ncbi:diguanylate cyclase [Anaerosolibacter carboniphilus]|uniref:Diguanylate cyclase n=1 Tax=Anaerosolibacter carboniphilus TaxID=1417629 RepID=A0A841KWQ8_9FIRM|nr:GGDEF domain-containing protein [Anaerosolibacter carboniphilus]MBB6218126.1 diguanylate cyclase [Anaerosolibacter carboniphilus]
MVNDLFINVLLLISFTSVSGHILKEVPESLINKTYWKVLIGIGGGILGILMMVYTIQVVGTNTLLDLRALSMIMVSSMGGLISTIVTGFIIVLYRVGYFGINQSSVFAVVHICLYVVSFHIINKKFKTYEQNWFVKLAVALVILVTTFLYLLRNIEGHYLMIFKFAIVVVCAGTLEYYLLKYTQRSNALYRIYRKDSTKDFLTGLNNTRSFDNLLNISFNRVKENSEKLSCLMIDIDHFKKVNDTFGHPVGDVVLREFADILKKNCRNFDIVGRVGGEEFCVLLLDCDRTRSFEIGMRIRDAVKEHKFPIGNDNVIKISVSIGVATYPDTVGRLEEIMEKADVALYKAKQTGRDKVCENS